MSKNKILLIFLAAIIGFLAGVLISFLLPYGNPVSRYIANPIVEGLSGNTEGFIIAKTNDMITLKKGNSQIEIYIEEGRGLTTFFDKDKKKMIFDEIRIGDYLTGGISILISPEDAASIGRKSGDLIAQRFTVSR